MRTLLAVLLLGLLGCGPEPSVVSRDGEPDVVVYPPGDDSMDQAIADARASVESFIAELPALEAEGAYVSVKAPIPSGDDTEHIWLSDPRYEDGRFHGTLGNEPLSPELALGDPHSIAADGISDWMAIRDGTLYGGYTVFVARDEMDPDQRSAFDANFGVRLPERPTAF